MTIPPAVPTFSTPMPQACTDPNKDARVVVAATPPPTEYQGEITQPTVVVVEVVIDGDGTVLGASVSKSSGSEKLDRAAIIAARKSTYSPRIVDCDPTRSSYLFRVRLAPPTPGPSPTPTPSSKIATHH